MKQAFSQGQPDSWARLMASVERESAIFPVTSRVTAGFCISARRYFDDSILQQKRAPSSRGLPDSSTAPMEASQKPNLVKSAEFGAMGGICSLPILVVRP